MKTPTSAPRTLAEWGSTEQREQARAKLHKRIVALAKRGKTNGEIYAALGCGRDAVTQARKAAGLPAKRGRPKRGTATS